jgi:hypothetical protein
MAKKTQPGDVNKSAEIRELIRKNPTISAADAISTLGQRGIEIKPNLYYFIKGKMKGRKGRRKKARQMVANVTATMGNSAKTGDVVATILKVKHLAAEVGGLKKLTALIEALEG